MEFAWQSVLLAGRRMKTKPDFERVAVELTSWTCEKANVGELSHYKIRVIGADRAKTNLCWRSEAVDVAE